MTSRPRRSPVRLLLPLLLVLLTACGGLPLPDGVRDADGVRGDEAADGSIVVVAPGPQPGMTAVELVTAFLYALSRSPQDDHAIARQFLAPDVRCCGAGEVILYPLATRSISVTQDASVVRVSYESVGRIMADGSYRLEQRRLRDDFGVVQTEDGLRLSAVPDGLRLLEDDLERSFTPYDVHFLGRSPDGQATGRLVPDRVFLPATTAEPAQALVDALLRGPTGRLVTAVLTAAPAGTRSQVLAEGGEVTVDLSSEVRDLDARSRQRLAAQLVWTLVPVYSGLRLLVEGEPFEVDGVQGLQDRSDWPVYDPAGVASDAPLLYLQDRRLMSLDGELAASAVTNGELPVDGAALAPATAQLAVLTRLPSGVDEVRVGPLPGPFGEPVLRRGGLTSLSWGSGELGLWVLETGSPAVVWWVPGPENGARPAQRVAYSVPEGAGPLTALQVSRDGARIALVLGGRVFVGRIEPTGTGVRIADISPVSRELTGVTDVAWQSGTSLVALGSIQGEDQLLPASVAADGSSFAIVQRPLVGATAVELAAAPRRELVVAADVDGRRQLYRDNGTLFRSQAPGYAPFYPG